jgi:hypothetical protein
MPRRLVSVVTLALIALPALVVAQQSSPVPVAVPVPAPVPVPVPAPVTTPAPVAKAPIVPAASVTPQITTTPLPSPTGVPVSPPPATTSPDITVNIGGGAPATGGLAPLPTVELPPGMVPPATKNASTVSSVAPLLPSRPQPTSPPAKLTPTQIAQQIAPNFDVTRDYVRLTQCYGMADFMGAVTRIQASRPGATPQIVNVARTISGLQDAMQPMVLAASTVRGEARFRADYDAVARRGQTELATSRAPNVTMQRRLATLDACRTDVTRWRGGR